LRAVDSTLTTVDLGFALEFDAAGTTLFDTSSGSTTGPNGAALANVRGGSAFALVDPSFYPPGTPVGNDRGGLDPSLVAPTAVNVIPGATNPGNLWPWCIDPTGTTYLENSAFTSCPTTLPAWVAASNLSDYVCPCSVIKVSQNCNSYPPIQPATGSCFGNERANEWAVHGAINAGMSVFLYVKSLETAAAGPAPDYNECPTTTVAGECPTTMSAAP
jgi:hypothetical protein